MVRIISAPEPPAMSLAQARNNLTDVAGLARHQRCPVVLTSHGKPKVVLFPLEMLDAVQAAGGYAKALEVLKQHAAAPGAARAPSEK